MPVDSVELTRVRKVLPLGLPCAIALLGAAGFSTFRSIPEFIQGLQNLSPVIRIYPGVVLGLTFLPLAVMMIVISVMKAIPIGEEITRRSAYLTNLLVGVNFLVLLLMMSTSTFLQSHYMPRLGYSKCTELRGNPTMWFTDWVKNPDWCVRGKTREWVNEQARSSKQ